MVNEDCTFRAEFEGPNFKVQSSFGPSDDEDDPVNAASAIAAILTMAVYYLPGSVDILLARVVCDVLDATADFSTRDDKEIVAFWDAAKAAVAAHEREKLP